MKRSYLTTVAAIALLAGAGTASAQRMEGPASKNESPSPAPQVQQKAPAEKMDKGAQQKPSKPETTGQAQPKSADDTKAKPKSADDSKASKPSTTGQAQPKSDTQQPSAQPKSSDTKSPSAQPKSSETTQQPAQKSPSTAQQPGSKQAPTTGQATAPTSAAVNLTTEQRTQIRSTVLTANAPRVSNVNFALSVGTAVPTSVRLVAVPDALVRIHPAWRGHLYFVVNDEIIIVDARTHKIVAVLVV